MPGCGCGLGTKLRGMVVVMPGCGCGSGMKLRGMVVGRGHA